MSEEDQDIEELKKMYIEEIGFDENHHNNEKSRRDTSLLSIKHIIILAAIIIPTSLLIFVLGFFTGRETSLNYRDNVLPLESKILVDNTSNQNQKETGGNSAYITSVDSLTTQKFAFYVTVTPMDTPPSQRREIQESFKMGEKEREEKPEQQVQSGIPLKDLENDLILEKKTVLPDLKKPGVTHANGKYTVQVGAYRKRGNAKSLLERLSKKGYPTYITETVIPEKGLWYRVRIGYFQTVKEAAQFSSEFTGSEKLVSFVTLTEK
ncbi:MAG: SPOR domain-containing protein [Thermodesulfobacteriota bacterium]|nr:SPOR domain-containing protein [Thermodesulfobacteriota bacterium]